jgi:hypothetical protein
MEKLYILRLIDGLMSNISGVPTDRETEGRSENPFHFATYNFRME